jgi:hypothetical protein
VRASGARIRLRIGALLAVVTAFAACGGRQSSLPGVPQSAVPGVAARATARVGAFAPLPSPTPIGCGSGGLTDCYVVPAFDGLDIEESGTDLFCFGGNPSGTWNASPAPKLLAISFDPAITTTCGQTDMHAVAKYNGRTTPIDPDETIDVGTVAGDPVDVEFKVPGRFCFCYAVEIYNSATNRRVDPFLIAAVAAQERCEGTGCAPAAPNPFCGTNAPGPDGTGYGVLQIDAGSYGAANFAYATSPWANVDYGTELIAYWEKVYGSETAALAHFHGPGSVVDRRKPAGPAIPYATDVEEIRSDMQAGGYGFDCVTNPSSVADVLQPQWEARKCG